MPTTIPSVEVPAVPPTPYPFGLFSIAPVPTPSEGNRWEGGVWWMSSGCNEVGLTYGPCNVDAPVPVPALVDGVDCGYGIGHAFTVYARSVLSVGSAGTGLAAKQAQARDVLLAGEQYAVEQALWALLVAATAVPIVATAADAAHGVAIVEAALPSVYAGAGVIHLPRYGGILAGGANVLRVQGSNLTTFLGLPVVAGGGYGTAPTTATSAFDVIGTGRVVVIRGDITDLGQTVNQQSNEVQSVVQRSYVVGWDCAAVRVHVNAS